MAIKEYLNKLRKDYSLMELNEKDVDANPIVQFEKWMVDAANAEVGEPNAMVLSTVDANHHPHSRIVLLRNVAEKGFSFYTNYDSDKGQEMENQPFVALNFFWVEVERQVRIEGKVEKLSLVDSVEYFKSRPRESQISAWASPQSKVIDSRDFLEKKWKESEELWKDHPEIEKPDNWGGYIVVPSMIEFWQGRPGRLHDRIRYTLNKNTWEKNRLAP
jgi:pyridoxamine 5'-phosphate oxidase